MTHDEILRLVAAARVQVDFAEQAARLATGRGGESKAVLLHTALAAVGIALDDLGHARTALEGAVV